MKERRISYNQGKETMELYIMTASEAKEKTKMDISRGNRRVI